TPRFDAARAEALLRAAAADLDVECPVTQATTITLQRGWPAYRLPATSPLPGALREGALRAFGRTPPPAVVGPSNAGNYLAGLGGAADHHTTRLPRREHVVDHQGHLGIRLHVAELGRDSEVPAADVDGVELRVVLPPDRHVAGLAGRVDGGQPAEPALGQVVQ